jgi:acyl carrier protein
MEALAGKSRKEAQAWVLNYVATQVAAVLGLEAVTEVAHGRTFIQMGMDSLTSVELRNRLQKGLGLALAATLAFEFPTVPAMAGHLTKLVQPEAPDDDACEPVGGDSHEPELSDEEATALLAKEIENLAASSLNGRSGPRGRLRTFPGPARAPRLARRPRLHGLLPRRGGHGGGTDRGDRPRLPFSRGRGQSTKVP